MTRVDLKQLLPAWTHAGRKKSCARILGSDRPEHPVHLAEEVAFALLQAGCEFASQCITRITPRFENSNSASLILFVLLHANRSTQRSGDTGVGRRREFTLYSGGSIGSANGGSFKKLNRLICSTASRIACSDDGSTVITNGKLCFVSLGNCSTASRLICFAAIIRANSAIIPGPSSTRNRK